MVATLVRSPDKACLMLSVDALFAGVTIQLLGWDCASRVLGASPSASRLRLLLSDAKSCDQSHPHR
jgi:hypothetical protein